MSEQQRIAATLADLSPGDLLLVVTGAGVSTASGIPTFRGSEPGAVWRQHDVELATHDYFRRDPVGQWRWYLERFRSVDEAEPNAAHRALRRIEEIAVDREVDFLLVTQNIDCLHEAAGSERLIKVHGTSDRVRCSADADCELAAPQGSLPRREIDLEPFERRPSDRTLPRCPRCDAPLRAHVLFFDEFYTDHVAYRFAEVEQAAATAAVVLFVGTSFAVGVTDLVLRQALARQRPVASIDPAGLPAGMSRLGIEALRAPAERALPELAQSWTAASSGSARRT